MRQAIAASVFGAVLLASAHTAAQEPTATFESETNLVEWACGFYLGTSGTSTPITHMTEANFSVVLDKKVTVTASVLQPTPGSYRLYFSPPDTLRDGKKHRVDVTILDAHPNVKRWKMATRKIAFPKPASAARTP